MVDLGRGAVMAIMALDHTRTFFTSATYNPSDLTRTYPALFLTRLSSHLCTPSFVLLAGAGAFLLRTRRSAQATAWFLVTRGVLLIGLEMTIVRWGWYFNFDYRQTRLQILWAIGGAMMLLAPLVFVPPRVAGAVGVAITALHNLLPAGSPPALPVWLWAPLYERGRELPILPDVVVTINFPVLPLFGVMAIGYALGGVFTWPERARRRTLIAMGGGCLAAFVLLRLTTAYGDPIRWAHDGGLTRSAMSFLLLTKHPLSLLMSLSMIGVGLLWLGVVRAERRYWQPLVTIGRVPMYFYLIHVPLIHALAVLYSVVAFRRADWLFTSPFDRSAADVIPQGWGFDLPGVYGLWILVVVILYPSCAWLARIKARSRSRWLSYL